MLRRVRIRLALLFILLTSIVYLATSTAGMLRFWVRMNAELEEQTSTLSSEVQAQIVCKDGMPNLDRTPVKFHQHVSIQLYAPDGQLLQTVGDKGVPVFAQRPEEGVSRDGVRYLIRTFPLTADGGNDKNNAPPCKGFLQVEVATDQRDVAIQTYLDTLLVAAPVLLIGLTVAGSYFSSWAVRPLDVAMGALKRFLADASHELGTPLAIFRATTDNLMLDVAGLPEAEERVEILTRATERMSQLVADMTHLARMESAELTMNWQTLHLDTLVSETVTTFKELLAEKRLNLTCRTTHALIKGDRSAIERLLTNLLQNAIRYTGEGGNIDVDLSVRNNSAILSVADTGIGIPREAIDHVFKRFYRVEKARTTVNGGSGLGLAIVKATATAHGGTVWVSSREGRGTTFFVGFPTLRHA
ncbi:MAG TPA: HAMP domain-containing sensor histidine kinase [Candidatus Obscuribacterales bacterium]